MKRQGIQERAGFVAVGWMDEHSDRFIYDYQMLVFENYIERDVLWDHRVLAGRVKLDLDKIIRPQTVADVLPSAVYLAFLRFYYFAQVYLAQTAKLVQQKILQPHFVLSRRRQQLDPFVHI